MEYIKRFKDITLDCYDHYEERTLVEMCMTNMIREYRAVLENLDLPVCTVVTKGQKDCPICKTERGQKKCSAGYGSVYW